MRPIEDGEFDIFLDSEDAPQIAGIVDERGPVDFSDKKRWKIIANDDEGDITFATNEKEENYRNKISKPQNIDNHNRSDNRDKKKNLSKYPKEHKKRCAEDLNKYDADSDLSPPRKCNNSDSDLSPARKYNNSDSDLSPPRKCNDSDSDISPPRKRNNSDLDLSPPRKRNDSDSDLSPPRKRNNSDSDLSPPRKKHSHSNLSPPRKHKGYNSDLSPPRRSRKHDNSSRKTKHYESDLNLPRKDTKHKNSDPRSSRYNKYSDSEKYVEKSTERRKYNDSYSHRKRSRKNDESDLSPPRRTKRNEDSNVNHSRQSKEYRNSDIGPSKYNKKYKTTQRELNEDSDLSPPRQSKQHIHSHRNNKHRHSDDNSPMRNKKYDLDFGSNYRNRKDAKNRKHSDEPKENKRKNESTYYQKYSDAGTSGRKDIPLEFDRKTENNKLKYEERHEKRMKKTLDGKTAGLQDAKALREETEAYKRREAEQFSKLSKEVSGVGQAAIVRDTKTGRKRNLEAEAAEEREAQKRQAELNEKYAKWGKGLKQIEDQQQKLENDLYEMSKPLARYADDADLDKALREQEREGDPMLEYIKQKQIKEGKRKPEQPKYEGMYAPNRFGIRPGHRWDGVDRSNGYEKKWFEAQSSKVAIQEEAYKWSTADM